VEDLEGL